MSVKGQLKTRYTNHYPFQFPIMARPFKDHETKELQSLFEAQQGNVQFLRCLLDELVHRKRGKAVRLRQRVEKLLAETASQSGAPQTQDAAALSVQHPPSPPSAPSSSSIDLVAEDCKAPALDEQLDLDYGMFSTTDAVVNDNVVNEFPPVKNDPFSILSAWMAMEVLAPPTFNRAVDLAGGDATRVARFTSRDLPWERSERSRPGLQLYYQVVLGTMEMSPAIQTLVEKYRDSRPERAPSRGYVPLASVTLDRHGRLVEKSAVGISSFPWG